MSFREPFLDPIATVLEAVALDDGLRVVLWIEGTVESPLYPASLLSTERVEVLRLDRLVEQGGGGRFVFERYGPHDAEVIPGQTFIFRPWWTPEALALVEDTSREWVREPYPGDADHEHCPLTWETIASYEGDGTGYRSGRDWISVAAFEQYVRDDRLRVRGSRS